MVLFNRQKLHDYMSLCMEYAKQNSTIKRNSVGALVLSEKGKIIGKGYTELISGTNLTLHAERMAIDNIGSLQGNTLVTTLEPCVNIDEDQNSSSCCELIVKSGIESVVIGLIDAPDNVRSAKGIIYLEENGIKVIRYKKLNDRIANKLMDRKYQFMHFKGHY